MASYATGTVTLAWDASTSTNIISNYKVYYGTASGTYSGSVSAGTATTASVSNLVEGATYYFAATATDTDGLESGYSTEVSTLIPVKSTNQPPTLNTIVNLTIDENASQQTVNLSGIGSGSASESQTLTVTASSSNTGLIPTPTVTYTSPNTSGSIRFTPVAYANGSSVITVTVNDGGASNNIITRTFTVTVNPVNQAPTLNTLTDLTINEGASQQTVNLAGIGSGAANESQTLTVTATSSNPGLIPAPTVTYSSPSATGSIRFTPTAFGFGSATITVTVNDGGASNNIVSHSFLVTVSPVNQAPTLNTLANVTINESASAQTVNLSGISSGATNEADTLTITAVSSNPSMIPTPVINYTSPNATGTLTFTPALYAFGTATITVTVDDGNATSSSITRTFTVTVNPVNQAPTLDAVANISVNENASQQTVNLTGIGSGAANESQTLTVTASSSNTGLIPTPTVTYTSPGTSGSLKFTPVANAYGSSTVTVTVNDGGASNNVVTRTFTVTVNQVNEPPTISSIPNQMVVVGGTTTPIPFTVADAETAASSLTVSRNSDNTALVPLSGIVLGGSGASRTVTITPAAGQSGVANITVTVSDGTDTASSVFQLSVRPRPSAPGGLRIASVGP